VGSGSASPGPTVAYHHLPDNLLDGPAARFERFSQQGLQVMIRDGGELRPATAAEHGWTED